MRPDLFAVSLLALASITVFASCGTAPPPSAPAEPVARVAPVAASTPSVASGAPGSVKAASTKRRFTMESMMLPTDLEDDTGPAPCDFDRSYRGTVGETPVTLLVRPGPEDALGGLGHYDNTAPPIALSGSRNGAAFSIHETPGGTFRGTCGPDGTLRGEVTLGKKKLPFALKPRPSGWPALHLVTRKTTAEPSHPLCRKAAKPGEAVETSETDDGPRIVCLPTNPAAKRRLLADAPELLCSATDSTYRVFGTGDAKLERAVNALLAASSYDTVIKDIRNCSGVRRFDESASLVHVSRDLMVVSSFRSDDFGGAHPLNGGGGARAIDLTTGTEVSLDKIVDPSKLRDLVSECLPVFVQVPEEATPAGKPVSSTFDLDVAAAPIRCGAEETVGRYLWACDKGDLDRPVWSLVPGGVVIGAWGNPHATAANDGHGPVLSWDVLLRAGLLRKDSPVARLWAGVTRAGPTTLPCSSAYDGSAMRTWREVSP